MATTTAAKKASTTTKKQAAPAKKAEPTRNDLLRQLADLGWTGPTSYTATILNDVLVPWIAAGCQDGQAQREQVPAGAMNHAHPKPKAERKQSASYLKGRHDALVEVGSLMQGKGATVAMLRSWLLEQVEAIAASGEDAA